MSEPYRFGGPIPESVQTLQRRRRYRGSQSFATLKKNRRQDFLENPGSYWEQVRDGMGAVIDIRPKVVQAGAEAIVAAVSRARQAVAETVAPPRKIAPVAPVAPELSATANKLTPLCAWRVDGPNFGRPGFTTDLEQAKFWVRRGATVTALHQPSEEGRFRTVSGAVLEKLTPPQSVDATAPCCTRCGNGRVVLTALISEGANRWRCECGATGLTSLESRAGEAPPLASSQTAAPLPGSDPHFVEFPQ